MRTFSRSRLAPLLLGSVLALVGFAPTDHAAAQQGPKPSPGGPSAKPPAEPQEDKDKGPDARVPDERAAKPKVGKSLPETPQERAKLLDELYAHLAAAEDEQAAGELAQAVVRLWLNSGSDTVDVLMHRALKAISEKNLELAEKLLGGVVELAPDHADAWSQLGHVHYQQNDSSRALGELRRAIALDPNHFKALDGIGTILREAGQKKGALKAFEQLLDVHPFWSGARQAVDELKREVDGQGL